MSTPDVQGSHPASGFPGKVFRTLCITFTADVSGKDGSRYKPHPRSKVIRNKAISALVALYFLCFGTASVAPFLNLLAQSPFDLDTALRTLSAGWFHPRDVIPVMVVDIDEETHRAWNSPASTPPAELARLVEIVSTSDPLAVVVDIDFSGAASDPAGMETLREFLSAYTRNVPLIFPKRLEPGAAGGRRPTPSPLDGTIAANSRLAWAHASFESDSSGIIRQWADWVEICTDTGTEMLPSVLARLSAMWSELPSGLSRPHPPPKRGECRGNTDVKTRLLLAGPRLTGPSRAVMTPFAGSISAMALLDPEMARDDAYLFSGRVVLIGATHSASRDIWLTPGGVLPGVELLANTVHYSPLQSSEGFSAEILYRFFVLGALAVFSAVAIWLRGVAAVLAYSIGGVLYVCVAVWLMNYYRVFEALEAAIVLVILSRAVVGILNFIEEWKEKRSEFPGRAGIAPAAWAVMSRQYNQEEDDD